MTNDRDFIGLVEAYLDEYQGSTPLPEDVRNAVRREVPQTRQARGSGPAGQRFGWLAAAAVIAVAIGISLWVFGPQVGGPTPSASASPSALEATPTPVLHEGPSLGVPLTFDPPADFGLEYSFVDEFQGTFIPTDGPEDHGIRVALPGGNAYDGVIWCFGPGNGWPAQPTADEVLRSYREWLAPDNTIPDATATALGGLPASTFTTPAAQCPTLHPSEREHAELQPGEITVVDVGGTAVVVAIWGQTDALYQQWLPTATAFINTFQFTP